MLVQKNKNKQKKNKILINQKYKKV